MRKGWELTLQKEFVNISVKGCETARCAIFCADFKKLSPSTESQLEINFNSEKISNLK